MTNIQSIKYFSSFSLVKIGRIISLPTKWSTWWEKECCIHFRTAVGWLSCLIIMGRKVPFICSMSPSSTSTAIPVLDPPTTIEKYLFRILSCLWVNRQNNENITKNSSPFFIIICGSRLDI